MLVVVGKSSAELEAIYRKVIILLIYHSEDVPGWESKRTTTGGPYRQGNNLYMYSVYDCIWTGDVNVFRQLLRRLYVFTY